MWAVASVWTNMLELSSNYNKEFIMFIIYLMVLSMCNASDVHWTTEKKRHSDENYKRDYQQSINADKY